MKSFSFSVTDESNNRTILLSLEKSADNNYIVICCAYTRTAFNYREIFKKSFKDYDDAWIFYISQIEILTY